MKLSRLIIEADGGSRGNPGPSGSGAVIIDAETDRVITEISAFGGVASNNVAEYRAVIAALREVFKLNPQAEVLVRMDSKLVVEQMSGNWKIKHPDMQLLGIEVQRLIAGKKVMWQWIPREQNSRADALANQAMDTEQDLVRQLSENLAVSPKSLEVNDSLPSSIRAPGNITEPLTTLILVRHGRTALTESHKISGGSGSDPSLSDLGVSDASAVAQLLSSFGSLPPYDFVPRPTIVVSSPMRRTAETAKIIAKALGSEVEFAEELREISFGDWDGETNEDVAVKWPKELEAWKGSFELSPPNGESLEIFESRTVSARKNILKKYAGKTVVVVAHVMPVRGFLKLALDAGTSGYWSPQIAPCSVTIIRQWGTTQAELVTTNFIAHL